jgi:hypothetical protein
MADRTSLQLRHLGPGRPRKLPERASAQVEDKPLLQPHQHVVAEQNHAEAQNQQRREDGEHNADPLSHRLQAKRREHRCGQVAGAADARIADI